ncbi:MAG: tetratricopeptide repeat protein [Firmicutes bacterium]|nr:tetratricopeptide repeat protein [Bacillota bacterium]
MSTKSLVKGKNSFSIPVLILSIIVFFMPFFRGLYFEEEFYIASLIISGFALIFTIKNIKDREKFRITSYLEYFVLAFVMIFIINFPFSVNKQMASFEIIKNLTYVITFLIISNKINSSKDISLINWILILSGTVVALIGLSSAMGPFIYNGAFVGGMINSTFQYHNTFGSYMLAMLFITMAELTEKTDFKRHILNSLAYILFLGFVFSYSRGSWILLPVLGLLAFIFLKGEGLKKVIISFISIIVSFGVTFNFVHRSIIENSLKGWLWIILGSILTVIITYLLEKIKYSKFKIKKKTFIIILITLGILIGGLIISGALSSFLPETVSERVQGISFKTFTAVERSVFYKDAFKIIKNNPIIGTGGGGWETLYSMYKTYDYSTTQAHNYVIQTWVEVGTIGLILLLGIYISFIWTSYKTLKNIRDDKLSNKTVGIVCGALTLVLHSIIDFDMALGGYAILFWLLIGVVNNLSKKYTEERIKKINISNIVLIVVICFVFIFSSMFKIGEINANKAVKNYKNKNYKEAMENFNTASKFAPFIPNYKFDLGNLQLSIGRQKRSKDLINNAIKNVENAIELNKTDFKALGNGISFYSKAGQIDKCIKLSEDLLKYHPLNESTYINVISIYYQFGEAYLKKGDKDKAKEYFEKVINVDKKVSEINETLDNREDKLLEGVKDAPESYIKERFNINLNDTTKKRIKSSKDILSKLK